MPPPPVWVVVDDDDLFEPIRRPGHPRRTIPPPSAPPAPPPVPPPPVLQLSAAEVAAGGAELRFTLGNDIVRDGLFGSDGDGQPTADAGASLALADALQPPPVAAAAAADAHGWAAAVQPRCLGSAAGRRRATIPSCSRCLRRRGTRRVRERRLPSTSRGYVVSCGAPVLDVAHIVVTKAPLLPLDATPAAGPVDGGTEVRVTAAGVASAAPLYCAFGDAPPVAARPAFGGGAHVCRAPAADASGPVALRLLQNDTYGGLLVSVPAWAPDDDEAAAAMLEAAAAAVDGLTVHGVWRSRRGAPP